MARGKFEYWLTEDGLTLLEGWARDGLTDEQLAEKMSIGIRTLYDWKIRYPQISQVLKKGKEIVDFEVENALLKSAIDGNTTAQIFWLKNRRPDKWRDKPVEDIGPKDETTEDDLSRSLRELGERLESDEEN
ncbi:helix-turn-helix domain-containing protein [Colidextribacter sp. OB.20]|uniref:helix-turn-helix domain-containing protein n=1 Tax=Colidextribacter sp. OB.20 TaxID=2304568 RepID=UPI001370B416|nr:helix-turn-helix domain-containing protein [Colidextribacter sp. OB.20]NBI10233.1 helix-turn-helix domain-containing protein [Colidextribacter sp. OB.20]